MSLAHIVTGPNPVSVTGESVVINDLTVNHAEAANLIRSQLNEHGPDAAADFVRRAVPVGLVALSMGTAGIDTGVLTRTLDGFAEHIDAKSGAALVELDQTLARLRAGEETVAQMASAILETLPAKVEAALAGQAGNVRASVAEAARAVQDAGVQELTTALARHSESVRDALSLDREGPVHTLRQDLLKELNGTRRELGEQLALVRALVESAQAAKEAGAKSSRAIGAANEQEAMALCRDIVTAAGDLFEDTGAQAGAGTSRRTGDAVATLSPVITGHGPSVRICLEAKHRTRPLSVKALRDEINAGCRNRDAAGGLVLVSTPDQLPGEAPFVRLGPAAYAVAASDPETVSLIYLLLREVVVATHLTRDADSEIDLAQVEARLKRALAAVDDLDEMGRLAGQAQKALTKLLEIGRQTQQSLRTSLTEGVTLLHP